VAGNGDLLLGADPASPQVSLVRVRCGSANGGQGKVPFFQLIMEARRSRASMHVHVVGQICGMGEVVLLLGDGSRWWRST
jgi:hypothetical protein